MTRRHPTIHQSLRSTLLETRLAAGVSQTELANELSWPQSVVSKIESGEGTVSVGDPCDKKL